MNQTERDRLTKVETRLDGVCKKLDKIIDNHLPHLTDSINELRTELSNLDKKVAVQGIKIGTIVGLIVTIGSAIINRIL